MAYTAMLVLNRAWLSDAINPANFPVQCGTRQPQDAVADLDGEFRDYAGDRTQMVSRNNHHYVRPIVLVALAPAQKQQIEDWRGVLLCLRTIDGDRYFGGYLSVQEHRHYNVLTADGLSTVVYDLTLTFTATTYTEAV